MKLTVLIPTLRRTADLRRCLDALGLQQRRPDQIVVVVRPEDGDTREMLRTYPPGPLPLEQVLTDEPGMVAALNTGLGRATGDVISIIDDDTAPWPDWLARVEAHFEQDPRLGGLGGRDIIKVGDYPTLPETDQVGRVRWYGRWIGEAHRGAGPARDVELLKGCNMSFRREAIDQLTFDRRLRGHGAQWFNDSAFSLAVKQSGWRILYDPSVRVDHYLGARPKDDERVQESAGHAYDVAYNETLILLEYLNPVSRALLLGFGFLVGSPRAPGVVQSARRSRAGAGAALAAAWRGRLHAWRDFRRSRRGQAGHAGPNQMLAR